MVLGQKMWTTLLVECGAGRGAQPIFKDGAVARLGLWEWEPEMAMGADTPPPTLGADTFLGSGPPLLHTQAGYFGK